MERLRIVGDGTRAGTKVFLNGLEVRNVQHVSISVGLDNKPTASLTIRDVDLDLDGQFEMVDPRGYFPEQSKDSRQVGKAIRGGYFPEMVDRDAEELEQWEPDIIEKSGKPKDYDDPPS